MSDIHISGPVAFMEGSKTVVTFSTAAATMPNASKSGNNTATIIKQLQTALQVAPWGEDNRFPQNIENHMAFCGIGKAALNWKASALAGAGIVPGRLKDFEDDGKTEIFQPLKRSGSDKIVWKFFENRNYQRYRMEFNQDWVWFGNCFSEIILSNDCTTATGLCHQESCDARYKQMNDDGIIEKIYLSKMWGMAKDQFAKFDPKKAIKGLYENPQQITEVDGKYVKELDCIDMYNKLESLTAIAEKLKDNSKKLKSAILPVNFPSPNKTYYQVPSWDGARLAGWTDIAIKIPSLVSTMYNKSMRPKYHVEIPMSYFEDKYGKEIWSAKNEEEQKADKLELLKDMETYLTGTENAFGTFVSFFDYDRHAKTEFGRIKITAIEDKSSIDKDLLTTSAANVEILMAMQVHPSLFSAGAPGSTHKSGGGSGSDIREAFLVYNALLNAERQLALEPEYLVRDFNGWDEDIVFRIRDVQLTTLDKNSGTTKTLS